MISATVATIGGDQLATTHQAAGQRRPIPAFTSELDAAPEILQGSLLFRRVRDASAEPQTVSVIIDGRRSLPRIASIVAELLVDRVSRLLDEIRAAAAC